MKRLLIVTPVVFLAGYFLIIDQGSDQMSSAEYMIGRLGSDMGSAVNAMTAQVASWFSG